MKEVLIQIVVTIVGSVTPLLVKQFWPTPATSKKPGQAADGSIADNPHLLDLSVLLIYGAFLSAILSHSMIVSGQTRSFSAPVLAGVAVIAAGTSVVLYWAWRKGVGEMAAGAMSLAALIVLLIAPGNISRTSEDQSAERGLPLELPVFTLTFVTAMVIIYLYGNPLARETLRRQRRLVGTALLVLAVGTAVILGYDFVADSVHDPRAPQFVGEDKDKDAARKMLASIRALDLTKRGLFYRFASDIALAPAYRAAYFTVRPEVEQHDLRVKAAAAKARAERERIATPPIAGAVAVAAAEPAVAPADSEMGEEEKDRQRQMSTSDIQELARKEARVRILSVASQYVDELDDEGLMTQIADRSAFVHPVPYANEQQVDVPMPGLDAAARVRTMSYYRVDLFRGHPALPVLASNTFEYRDVPNPVADEEETEEKTASKRRPTPVLPKIQDTWNSSFILQMSLPPREEAYLAYRTAMKVAASEKAELTPLLDGFERLPPDGRRAFVEYITPVGGEAKLQSLAKLNGGADMPGSIPTAADERYTFATKLKKGAAACNELPDTGALCDWMSKKFTDADAPERARLAEMISESDRQGASVAALFSKEVLAFAAQARTMADPRPLLDVIGNPMNRAMVRTAKQVTSGDAWLATALTSFSELTPENRQQILTHIAIMLYRGTGTFSLTPLRLLALQAYSVSPIVAIACALLLMFPGCIAAIALGGFAARQLVDRDRTRTLIAAEQETGQVAGDIGLPVDLLGRETLLARVRKLGGRGWSTIALVGRRGIGKSRVLHELYKPADPEKAAAVSVWMAAPTSYDEADFVGSVFERLALQTERAVADQLKAKPLAVRLLEKRQATTGILMFTTALLSLALLLWIAHDRLVRPEIMITWVPILLVAAVAIAVLVRYVSSSVQPIDLTSWLERDRSRGASAVLLYREAQAALRYLTSRRLSPGAVSSPVVWVAAAAAGVAAGSVVALISFIQQEGVTSIGPLMNGLGVAIGLTILIRLIAGRKGTGENGGSSMMSLTTNYRRFAATVVHHVHAGALSEKRDVMICIDELDKVIEEQSVRDFLRRMKGIFEVPGIYYYISLAEDTLARLYLAGAEGKNEIDSSLDHIVRVQPLTLAESQQLVGAYATKLGFKGVDERLATAVAAISFGVPRDIIRRCDEIASEWVGPMEMLTVPDTGTIAAGVRRERVMMACEREGWRREVRDLLAGDADEAARVAMEMFGTLSSEREQRVIALLWTLCVCEIVARARKPVASTLWKSLYRLGYELPTMPLPDVSMTIGEITAVLATPESPAEDDETPPPSTSGPRPRRRRVRFNAFRDAVTVDTPHEGNGGSRTPL